MTVIANWTFTGPVRELALHAAGQLTAVFEVAAGGDGPAMVIQRMSRRYRQFANEHPGLYQALLPAPKPGKDDELYAALTVPVTILSDELARAGIAEEQIIHLIRALRSMLHGFIDLEMKDGFGMPVDIDASFDHAVDAVVSGVLATAPQ